MIIINFHFAPNTPNFIGFGLNLSLLEIFKVIKHPKFNWIWTKPHDTLGNVSDKKTTLMYLAMLCKIGFKT